MNHATKTFLYKEISFCHPFTCMISGPTGSGKTYFIRKFLGEFEQHINLEKLRVLYAYGVYQSLYNQPIKNENLSISYHAGMPTNLETLKSYDLLILDDLMAESTSNTDVSNIFTRYSHHFNISVIFITQNLFSKGKEMRTISLNCHYFILLKNRRDVNQIMVLGRQLFHKNSAYFNAAYESVMKEKYGYLLVDTRPECPEFARLRTSILTSEAVPQAQHKGVPTPLLFLP